MRIVVAAPPKAGNMWLKCLLSSIYDLRWLKRTEFPPQPDEDRFRDWTVQGGFPDDTIFHQHFDYSDTFCAAVEAVPAHLVTIVRDPYDAFVSTYFTMQQHAEAGNRKGRKLDILMDKPLDHDDVFTFLAEGGYENNLVKANNWLHSGRAVALRYEDLHRDPTAALTRATEAIRPVDQERLTRAVADCAADTMRQRGKGMARHVRTATVGDSTNYLTERHLAIFRDRYADQVRRLGYPVR